MTHELCRVWGDFQRVALLSAVFRGDRPVVYAIAQLKQHSGGMNSF